MDLCSSNSTMANWHSISCVTKASLFGGHKTIPGWISFSSTPESFIRTFSPHLQMETSSSSCQSFSILQSILPGIKVTFCPTRQAPDSVLPMTMHPISAYLSITGIRNGAFGSRSIGSKSSKVSKNDLPVYQSHSLFGTRSLTFVPFNPEIGTNVMSFSLYPHTFKNGISFVYTSSNRFLSHLTLGSSILFTTTTNFVTPKVFANCACSLVCPPFSNPVSNSPFLAAMTKTPTSACAAPAIMFGT
mmetsp:Transcript_537/g.1510  ORF Transcript_537/g.1510 Transcript_537/m.1510 type:complete len:245 (-) Transcript_537:634-1368(-)